MNRTLLIADANDELRDHYRQFLSEYGYDVKTSSNGVDCLRNLRLATPSVLVLDLELRWGGSDGVLDWVRKELPPHAIAVILTASLARLRDDVETIKPPVVDYLLKPFDPAALLKIVRSTIESVKRGTPSTHQHKAAPQEIVAE